MSLRLSYTIKLIYNSQRPTVTKLIVLTKDKMNKKLKDMTFLSKGIPSVKQVTQE